MQLDPRTTHTVTITGGAGFVMGALVRLLLRETAWNLRIVVHPGERHAAKLHEMGGPRITVFPLDISACGDAQWQSALEGSDGVVHGAAVSPCEPSDEAHRIPWFIDVNTSGALALCAATRRHAPDARVVHVSSVAVYGHPSKATGFQTENDSQEPVDAYDITKYAGERLALRFAELQGQDLYVVRLTRIFGKGEHPTEARQLMSLPCQLADSWAQAMPFHHTRRSPGAETDLLAVESAVDAIRLVLVGRPAERVFNLGGGGALKVGEIIALAREALPGLQVATDDGPSAWDADPENSRGKDGVFDIARATHQLGWRPDDVRSSLRSYFQCQLKSRG